MKKIVLFIFSIGCLDVRIMGQSKENSWSSNISFNLLILFSGKDTSEVMYW